MLKNDLDINNFAFLLSFIRDRCAELQYGGASCIFDNVHDWVNFFCDLGQCQAAITLYKQGRMSKDLCSRIINIFELKHKSSIENLAPK